MVSPIPLPPELLEVVAEYACHNSSESCGLSNIDFRTALSLALVSKRYYRLSNRLLYTHVRLTKPSDVLLYARTALSRPALCSHTQSLWIGPDEHHLEPRGHWPLVNYKQSMRSSITDPSQLPIGVRVTKSWIFVAKLIFTEDWLDNTAARVIREASRRVGNPKYGRGVSLLSGGSGSYDGKELDVYEGHARIYRVQQILDCFLLKVRKRQQSYTVPCRPSLAGYTTIRDVSSQYSVPGYQPGAPSRPPPQEHDSTSPLRLHDAFDRFDHPMLFSRSVRRYERPDNEWDLTGVRPEEPMEERDLFRWAMVFEEEEDIDVGVYEDIDEDIDDYEDNADLDTTESIISEQSDSEMSEPVEYYAAAIRQSQHEAPDIVRDYSGDCYKDLAKRICEKMESGMPTRGLLILFSRVILKHSPSLVSLALTSYLQHAVTEDLGGQDLKRLHSLALGPPAQVYDRPLQLSRGGLASVKRLKLWGEKRSTLKRRLVAHAVSAFLLLESRPSEELNYAIDAENALPALESVQCTWTAPNESDPDGEHELQ